MCHLIQEAHRRCAAGRAGAGGGRVGAAGEGVRVADSGAVGCRVGADDECGWACGVGYLHQRYHPAAACSPAGPAPAAVAGALQWMTWATDRSAQGSQCESDSVRHLKF